MNTNLHVLAFGWYGAGNMGDELLLDMLNRWSEEVGATLSALSVNPAHTRSTHHIEATDAYDLPAVARALQNSDLFVLGGGGLFQTHHTFTIPALYQYNQGDISAYARPVLMARQMGLPTLLWAQGVGPLSGDDARQIVQDIFSTATHISVRDEDSKLLLAEIGVSRDIVVAPDPVWAYPIPKKIPHNETNKKRIALVIRPWSFVPGWEDCLVDALKNALPPAGCTLVWMPFQAVDVPGRSVSDAPFIKNLMRRIGDEYTHEWLEFTQITDVAEALAHCDSVVSMRLHAQILSLKLGKPTLCIEYDPKMAAVSTQVGVPAQLRLTPDAPADTWRNAFMAWANQKPMPLKQPNKLATEALTQRRVLQQAIKAAAKHAKVTHWQAGQFDWLSAWADGLAHQLWVNRDAQIAILNQGVYDRDGQITILNQSVYDRDQKIISLNQAVYDRDGQVANLNQAVHDRDGQIANLNQAVHDRDGQIASLNQLAHGHEGRIANLDSEIVKLTQTIIERNQEIVARDSQIQQAEQYKIDKEIYIANLLLDIHMRDHGLTGLPWKLKQRINYLAYNLNRAKQLLASGGFLALAEGLILLLKKRRNRASNNFILPAAPANTSTITPNSPSPLLADELVVITGVPFDDIGGGQRGAQLARCALKTGRKVVYIYVYPKFDFDLNRHVESNLAIPNLTHLAIDALTPSGLLDLISSSATMLIEFPHLKILPFLDMAKRRNIKTVFELIDDWETSLGGDWFDLNIYHQFVAQTDIVVGTAKLLVQRLVDLKRADAWYLPNAANEYIFDKYKSYARPTDLPTNNKKTALYFGSLYGEWFGWEYIITAAKQNKHLDIILIGDNPNKTGLPKNIYCLGAKNIEELPAYLMHTDIALLPFIPGQISDAVSPIKVFEYLFAGKPVVSTRLPEIADYPGIFIADSPKQFAELCKLATSTEAAASYQNDLFIAQHSWFQRLDKIVDKTSSGKFKGTVSAVILIHNNKPIIGRNLETLIAHGRYYLKEIIVVDNASIDGGGEFVEATFPEVIVLKNPVNGCSSGRNLGVSKATGDYLAFFDSDQWFTSAAFFEEALTILERDASVGVVGWAAGWFDKNRTDLGGQIADYCPNRAMNDVAIIRGYRSDIGYLGTGGFFLPKLVFDATDGFDVFYDPTCFEDTDLSFQIKKLGFKIAYRDLTGIRHQPHQTTGASTQSDTYTKLFQRNAEYFKQKWADYPEFFIDYLPDERFEAQ